MARVDRVKVSLRLSAEDLDPDEVTWLLGREPNHSCRKGDELPGRDRRVAKFGFWSLESEREEDDLEEQVAALLDPLPDDPAVWDRLHAICGDGMDLFCGLFLESLNRGTVLSPDLLRRIGERHLVLSLDIYGP